MSKMQTAGFSVVDWLECIWLSDLPPNSKYLACYLRSFMNSKQDIAWPSYSRIITETGLSRATVAKYLECLEESQWLIRDRDSRSTTTYIATLPQPVFDSFKGIKEAIKEGSSPAKLVREVNRTSSPAKPEVVRQLNTNIQGNKQGTKQAEQTQAEPSHCGIIFEAKDGQWTCPDDYFKACVKRYGLSRVNAEFQKAAFWALSNPSKRKTKRGMTRFLGSWLERNKGGTSSYPENQGVDASIHISQMNPAKPGLRYGEEAQFATVLTDEHKAKNEAMRGNLKDLLKGFDE